MMQKFLASPLAQPLFAFLRVSLATLVACWVKAGSPVTPKLDSVVGWVELAVQAGVALVIANYVGPWEQRYGINRKTTV